MKKKEKTEIALPIRIILIAPPPVVDLGIQHSGGQVQSIQVLTDEVSNLASADRHGNHCIRSGSTAVVFANSRLAVFRFVGTSTWYRTKEVVL